MLSSLSFKNIQSTAFLIYQTKPSNFIYIKNSNSFISSEKKKNGFLGLPFLNEINTSMIAAILMHDGMLENGRFA